MKQTILNEPPAKAQRKLRCGIVLCCAAAVLTLGLNIFLALCFTAETYLPFLLLNIAADVLCGFGIVFFADTCLHPRRICLRLSRQNGTAISCRVEAVSETTVRYLDMDCHAVTTDSRKLFLPCGTLRLEAGRCYALRTVTNVITEAEG